MKRFIFIVFFGLLAFAADAQRGYGFPAQDLRNPPDTGMIMITNPWPTGAKTVAAFWQYKSLIPGWGGGGSVDLTGIRDSLEYLYGQTAQPDTAQVVVYKPAHGQNPALCPGGILPLTENFDAATAANAEDLPFTYAIGTRGPDSLVIKASGFYTSTAHGLTIGQVYYQQDSPCDLGTTPGTIEAAVLLVIDANTIQLIDRSGLPGSDAVRVWIPSSQFTSRGDDPAAPRDSTVGAIALQYQSVGLARPGAIFVYQLPAGTNNPTYTAASGLSSTPARAWFWDGARATRITDAAIAVDMSATSVGGRALIPASNGTAAEAEQYIADNYENLNLPNGTVLYWKGSGSDINPDTAYIVLDNPTVVGGQRVMLVKSLASGDGNGIYGGSGTVPAGTVVTGFPRFNFNSNYSLMYGTGAPFTPFVGPYIIRNGIDQGGQTAFALMGVRGTIASPASPQDGNPLGTILFGGFTNALASTASMSAEASQNWSSSAAGTRLVFSTTATGQTSRSQTFSLEPSLAIRAIQYGSGTKTAAALGKTQSAFYAAFASDGTLLEANAPSGTTDLSFTGSASPVTLNSSTGTDVTLTAGTNVSFSQSGNNLTISTSAGNGIYGGSGTVPSSTEATITDAFVIKIPSGQNVFEAYIDDLVGLTSYNGDYQVAVNGGSAAIGIIPTLGGTDGAQMEISATTSTFTAYNDQPLNYGDDYSANFTARSIVDKNYIDTRLGGRALLNTTAPTANQTYLWDAVDARFEIGTVPGDGNGIYSGSGTVPNGTGAALIGTFAINTTGGAGLFLNQTGGVHFLGQSAGTRVQVNPSVGQNRIDLYGNGTDPANMYYQDADGSAQVIIAAPSVVNSGGYKITLPADAPNDGENLVYNGSGVYNWSLKDKIIRFVPSSAAPVAISTTFPAYQTLGGFNSTLNTAGFTVASNIDYLYTGATTKNFVLRFTASGDTASGLPVEFSYEINSGGKIVIATELGANFNVAGQAFVTMNTGDTLRFYVRPTSGSLTANINNMSGSLEEF